MGAAFQPRSLVVNTPANRGWKATPTVLTVYNFLSVGAAFTRDLGFLITQNLVWFLADRQAEDLPSLLKHEKFANHM